MKRILPVFLITMLIVAAFACTDETQTIPDATAIPVLTNPPADAIVDEVTVPITELRVLSRDDIPDPEALSKMTSLRLIDLTALPDTSFSEIESIRSALPEGQDCRFIWNQKLTDGIFRSDSAELTLPHATSADINLLEAFSDLRKVDATGSTEFEALYAFQTAHPDIEVHYAMKIGDRMYTETAEAIQVSEGVDPAQFLKDLSAFPNVMEIDLRESNWDPVWIESLNQSFPTLRIRCTVQISNLSFDSDAQLLDLRAVTQMTPDQLIEKLQLFSSLTTVALPSAWTDAEIDQIKSSFPGISVIGPVHAFGKSYDGAAEEIDLSGIAMQSTDEVEAFLQNLPFLNKLVMCECGLTNEQMEELCNAHPEIKFVWTLIIGKRKLRTDAIGFSTKNPGKYTSANASDKYNESVKKAIRLHEGDIEALKYCTDLEALDLGHNFLTDNDLTVIAGLTKLKILILADNKITDISALSSLKDLEYIELFMNKIPDLSPLCELPNLQDVNVCNTGVSDLSPLFSLTSVRRLWYAMNPFNREQAKALKEALPDCVCNYTTKDETSEGWRTDPRYQWMRSYFEDS